MAIGQGYKSYIQFGLESVWGTPVAATNRLEVISMDVNPDMGLIMDPSLNNSVGRRGLFQGGTVQRGTILIRANFQGLSRIFKSLLGVAGTSTLVETAVSWDNVFHDAMSQLTVQSLTIEMIEGDILTGKCQRLSGAIITACTIRGTAGQGQDAMLQLELTVVAKDKTVNITPTGALSAPAVNPVMTKHGLTIDNGVTTSGNIVRSFELAYRAPFADDRFYVGALNPAEFIRNDFVGTTWRFTEDLQTDSALSALTAFTAASPQLIFRGGALGANFYEFEVRSDAAQVARVAHVVAGYGVVRLELTVESYHHATNGTLYVRFRNGENGIL
jgi:tail tube protein